MTAEPVPNADLQYKFSKEGIVLNYKTPEMIGTVAPTDSRFRRDLSLHEEGRFDEAEKAKREIEEEQRRKRKKMKKGEEWKPNFFKLRDHPFLKDNKIVDTHDGKPQFYDFI